MASFVTDLWESIFTPGPTRSILVATNASFAALQLILLALLLGTYSVHFVVLSVLCAGLWWSINWFAREVLVVQAQQEREAREREGRDKPAEATEDSDTEVEGASPVRTVATGDAELRETMGELKQRGGAGVATSGTQSSVSTEDEWEKVSENEQEKDR